MNHVAGILDSDRAECRSCHAAILWAVNDKTGRRMPLDWDPPLLGGNVALVGRSLGVPQAHVLTDEELVDPAVRTKTLFASHFVTCPQAKQWRRPK